MYIKLAWRNIWRNKRRTLITVASILFAVFLSTLMQSIQRGAWDKMLGSVVNFYFGYVQLHEKGYWDEQSIDKAFDYTAEVDKKAKVKGVLDVIPRLESFALSSYGNKTKGALVVGIDPERESSMTGIRERIVKGAFLTAGDTSVVLGKGLAEYLGISLGDSLVLISQGYHGVNAAGKFPVKGLVSFGSPDLDKRMVYLPLNVAQYLYGAEGKVTGLAFHLSAKEMTPKVVNSLESRFDTTQYEIMDWTQMMPELIEAKEIDTAGALLMLYLLYIIVAFGIFGTIIMMTKERLYEFGVLISIGMHRLQLAIIVWLEILFMAFIGALLGMAAVYPLVRYYHFNPIDLSGAGEGATEAYEKFGMEPLLPAALDVDIFIHQAIVVFIIALVIGLYPMYQLAKMKPMEAMRE